MVAAWKLSATNAQRMWSSHLQWALLYHNSYIMNSNKNYPGHRAQKRRIIVAVVKTFYPGVRHVRIVGDELIAITSTRTIAVQGANPLEMLSNFIHLPKTAKL